MPRDLFTEQQVSMLPSAEDAPTDRLDLFAGRPQAVSGIIPQIKEAGGVAPYLKAVGKAALDIPLGAISEVGRMTGTPKWATPQPYDVSDAPARIGRFAGAAIPAAAITAATGGSAEVAGLPAWLGRIAMGEPAAGSLYAGKGKRKTGAELGLALGGLGETAMGAGKYLAPSVLRRQLAKLVEHARSREGNISKDLYRTAFKNTDNVRPIVNKNVFESLNKLNILKDKSSSGLYDYGRALNTYQDNPTLEGLHFLKSDLNKLKNRLSARPLQYTDTGNKIDALDRATKNIGESLNKNFDRIGGTNKEDYQIAQNHYKDKIVPFNKYSSVKKLLSPDREISNQLYTDLSKDSISSKKLRDMVNISSHQLNLGKFLRSRLFKYPLYAGLIGGSTYKLTKEL